MRRKWSLHIKEFAKIKELKLNINHMMVFVGDNGSGKSYVMTLLWGLISRSNLLYDDTDISKLKNYSKCTDWLKSLKLGDNGTMSTDMQSSFVDLYNELLHLKKDIFLQTIFNGDISIGDINIIDFEGRELEYAYDDFGLKLEDAGFWYIIDPGKIKIDYETQIKRHIFSISTYILFNELKDDDLFSNDILYFPAARTGFTLAYKTLLAGAVESAFTNIINEKKSRSSFSEPVVNFLKLWTLLEKNKSSMKHNSFPLKKALANTNGDAVKYLEDFLLKGKMKVNDMPLPDISFIPQGSQQEIPIHMTSSLITELAPLTLFLKYNNNKTIMIEEPEAHLHLKSQILMAKLLAKLLSNGMNVWITTHSDMLVQQLNTLIKLNSIQDKEKYLQKYDISNDECINYQDVAVYEFMDLGERVSISEVIGNEEGFEYTQFLDTIYNQTNLILDLESEHYEV